MALEVQVQLAGVLKGAEAEAFDQYMKDKGGSRSSAVKRAVLKMLQEEGYLAPVRRRRTL